MDKNRYTNGSIYKVVDKGYNKCYIGSTCESLSQRMTRHRASYNHYLQDTTRPRNTIYDMFDEFGVENCEIKLIEYCSCNNRDELRRREGILIKDTDCVNKRIEGRTRPEYREDNKQHKQQYMKNYNIEKKEEISENKKQYRRMNKDYNEEILECDCGAFVSRQWLQRHQKSSLHQRYLKYKNNELVNHVKCSCGSIVPNCKMNRHKQTKKHLKYSEA